MNHVNSYILHLCLKVLSDEILLHISLFLLIVISLFGWKSKVTKCSKPEFEIVLGSSYTGDIT